MNKGIEVYTYNGIFINKKRNDILISATKLMRFENIMLSKGSETQNSTYDAIYMNCSE